MFASRFNDDKQTLAFSDSVQDAAHRAGFFNSRTWRFGLRSAIQRYVLDGGAGLSLADFSKGFIDYWHTKMDNESFVSFFIAPNMTWRKAYEEMVEKRKFGSDSLAKKLMSDIENRLSYEIMLEYGLTSRIGRTLEKSGCSCLDFPVETIKSVAETVYERAVNEIGAFTHTDYSRFEQMVCGYLKIMSQNGGFDDKSFSAFLSSGNTYMLSNDRINWMPGRQSGRNTPRFIYKPAGATKKLYAFDTVNERKYINWIESCCDEILIDAAYTKTKPSYPNAESTFADEAASFESITAPLRKFASLRSHCSTAFHSTISMIMMIITTSADHLLTAWLRKFRDLITLMMSFHSFYMRSDI